MNLLTVAILAILAFGFLLGWYKGFINTLCNIASFFIAWLLALIFNGGLSQLIANSSDITSRLLYYTAGAEKLSDMTVANVDTASLSTERIREIISTSNLPGKIENTLEYNILNQVFYDDGISTMSDYFNQTLIILALHLICFLIIYAAVRVLLGFLIELADKTFVFPVLKKFDSPIAGAFGLLYGVMICFVIFSVLPLVLSVVDMEFLNQAVEGSPLAQFFYNSNIIFNVLSGVM